MSTAIKTIVAATALAAVAFQAIAQEGNSNMNNKFVENQAINLSVFQAGATSSNTVVFLHGDSGGASQWFPVMNGLSDSYSVVAFDQRGHGSSSLAAAGEYGYEARADDLRAVIASMDLNQSIILVAHSGSAGVALEFARAHGEHLLGIYFLDPATDPRAMPEEMRQEFMGAIRSENGLGVVQGYYTSIAGQTPGTIATVTSDAADVAPDARIGFAEALVNWNPEDAMSHWTGPTFMAITPANDTPAAIRHLGDSVEYEVLSTEGHWAQLDMPEIVAQSIRSFIAGLS